MYTAEQEQLRSSLNQFFGTILVNSNLKDKEYKKQSLVALVIEELLKVCKDDKEQVDIIAAKPIIKATHYLLEKRKTDIVDNLRSTSLDEEDIDNATEDLEWIVNDLKKYIDSLNDINNK